MSAQVIPSLACVLGKSALSDQKVTEQLRNMSRYAEGGSYEVVRDFLREHTNLLKADHLSPALTHQLHAQTKRVSHIVMEQVFGQVEEECVAHLVCMKGKTVRQRLHTLKVNRATSEIRFDEDTSSTIPSRRTMILSAHGKPSEAGREEERSKSPIMCGSW
jgi:hypothetical protein